MVSGFFAGGVTQGFEAALDSQSLMDYRQKQLQIQQQGQQNEQQRQLYTQASQAHSEMINHITETVKQLRIAHPEMGEAQIYKDYVAPFMPPLQQLDKNMGRDPNATQATVTAIIARPPAQVTEKALAEAKRDPTTTALHQSEITRNEAQAKSAEALATQRTGATWDKDTIALKVDQALSGDMAGALSGSGGGMVGNQNKAILMNAVAEEAKNRGMSGPQISSLTQQFRAVGNAQSAAARTGATRAANVDLILQTVRTAAPGAIAASEKVPRGSWVPVNELVQTVESKISDPNLKLFRQKNLQLAELWARSMNPTGVMRVEDRALALDVLSLADSPQTYKAAVNSIIESIGMEEEGAKKFLESMGMGSILQQHPKALTPIPPTSDSKDPLGLR